jgi:hypothetical protein
MVYRLTGNPPGDSASKDSSHHGFHFLMRCRSGGNFGQCDCSLGSQTRILGESDRFPDHRS